MKKIILTAAMTIMIFSLYSGESYNFLMLSDTHFGQESTFGPNPAPKIIKKLKRFDQAFHHYLAMFDNMAKTSDGNTKFLIHAGDMIEGWAHTPEAQVEQFQLLDKTLKKYFNMPIYMVRGNHESAGHPGRKGYKSVIAPTMAKNAGQSPDTINYTIEYGSDLFIFVDNYNPESFAFVQKTLQELQKRPRYIFMVIHVDQLPQVYAVKMCQLLAQYDAIILNGHTHRTRVLKYQRDGKKLTQFSIGSYLMPKLVRYGKEKTNLDEYLKNFRTSKHIRNEKMRQCFDTEIAPFITDYKEYAGIKGTPAGYARIHVSDTGVIVSVQSAYLADKPFDIPLVIKK